MYAVSCDGIKLVLKRESPDEKRLIAQFLRESTSRLLPTLRFLGSANSFLAYTWIDGELCQHSLTINHWTAVTGDIIAAYHPSADSYWGYHDEPCQSLVDFMMATFQERRPAMTELLGLDECNLVEQIITVVAPIIGDRPYCTHGDLGAHNILLHGGQVSGVIDPLVVNGLPILDLLFMTVSTPHRYGFSAVAELAKLLKPDQQVPLETLKSLYRIQLFNRIETCQRRHPQDLGAYLDMYHALKS